MVPNDGLVHNELPDNKRNDVGLDEAAGRFEEYDVGLNDVATNEIGTVKVDPNEAANNANLAEDPPIFLPSSMVTKERTFSKKPALKQIQSKTKRLIGHA